MHRQNGKKQSNSVFYHIYERSDSNALRYDVGNSRF